MDLQMETRFKERIQCLLECLHLNPNDHIKILENLQEPEMCLSQIWQNIESNWDKVRQSSLKNEVDCNVSILEFDYLFKLLKEDKIPSNERDATQIKLHQLLDRAIVNCSNDTKELAKLFAMRSMVFDEFDNKTLASIHIDRALDLDPTNAIYYPQKATLLLKMDKPFEAYRMINRAIKDLKFPLNYDLTSLRKLYDDIHQQLIEEEAKLDQGELSEELSGDDENGSSNDLQSSYNSDEDDNSDDRKEMADACREVDDYTEPYQDTNKNFSIDYRCEIRQSKGVKGIQICTTEPVEERSMIFRERPYSMAIVAINQYSVCHFCGRDVRSRFWPCTQCNQMVYCGQKCLEFDWNLSHQYDCGIISYWIGQSKSTLHILRLLNRLGINTILELLDEDKSKYDLVSYRNSQVQRFTAEHDKSLELLKQTYMTQMNLMDHSSDYGVEFLPQNMIDAIECVFHACMAQGIKFDDIPRDKMNQLIVHSLVAIRRIHTNGFRWTANDESYGSIATCYYMLASLFNHSCDPNCEWSIDCGYIYIRAKRKIEANEEITFSYGVDQDTEYFETRQRRLLEDYFFLCNCSACVDESRKVLALQCPNCPGPVLPNPLNFSKDSCCTQCLTTYPQTKQHLDRLKQTIELLELQTSLSAMECIDSFANQIAMKKSLEFICSSIYNQSFLLIQSIYSACKIFFQEGMLADCLQYGNLVDKILPVKGSGLIVISDPCYKLPKGGDSFEEEEEEYSKQDKIYSATYSSNNIWSSNIEHLLFWTKIYNQTLNQTEVRFSSKAVSEIAFRFYKRLDKLIKWAITYKEFRLGEMDDKEKNSFDTIGLREEINSLDLLKWRKQQEMKKLKMIENES
ncbi:hypothetical protein RDWZM_006449 [Blomia tropicalis]|uniref:Uncharacterized protein n=1 Tax=Blomia tropicalis TaxID=40697 RepID=A0A9Q0MAI8_BLOTA|nr:hypothetical protein RDWZM_006449 [Blomia tropicalis]